VLAKLQLRWYWPNMGRDVRRRVRQCEICQVNKHGHPPGEAGRRRLYAGRPWQAEAVNLVEPMILTPMEDSEEPPLYPVGDWVWVVNYRRRRRQVARSQPQLVGPYAVVEVMPNHTCKPECSGQVSIQNEARLKPYCANLDAAGEAPPLLEPMRQTTTRGRQRHGPEYKVVRPRAENLARQERPLPSLEVRPPPPAPSLTAPLPEPDADPEVQKPPRGGAPSGDIGEETTVTSRPETPPVDITVH